LTISALNAFALLAFRSWDSHCNDLQIHIKRGRASICEVPGWFLLAGIAWSHNAWLRCWFRAAICVLEVFS
jgi:hypothetical protein